MLCCTRAAGRHTRRWSYRFHVQGAGVGVKVTSAFLWLHKNRDVSSTGGGRLMLNVRSVYDDDDDDSSPSRRERYHLSWTSGWVQVDVSELVRRPAAAKLTVRCVGSSATRCRRTMAASSTGHRPFVVVGTAVPRHPPEQRNRRHLPRCVDGDCCALHPYYVNFTELNFTAILEPTGFYVNFCYGSCRSQLPALTVIAIITRTSHYQSTF